MITTAGFCQNLTTHKLNFYHFSHVPSQPTTPKFHSSLECFCPPFYFQRNGMLVCDRDFFNRSPVSLRLFNTHIKAIWEDLVSSNSWLCTKKFQTLYFKIGEPIFLCSINTFNKFWLRTPYITGTVLKTGKKWEKVRVGWFEKVALKQVYYHMWNRSLVQVWCRRQGAQGWCTGMTLGDGMGKEVGGGFWMGNTCTLMADSCQCMEKPLQYCKILASN